MAVVIRRKPRAGRASSKVSYELSVRKVLISDLSNDGSCVGNSSGDIPPGLPRLIHVISDRKNKRGQSSSGQICIDSSSDNKPFRYWASDFAMMKQCYLIYDEFRFWLHL